MKCTTVPYRTKSQRKHFILFQLTLWGCKWPYILTPRPLRSPLQNISASEWGVHWFLRLAKTNPVHTHKHPQPNAHAPTEINTLTVDSETDSGSSSHCQNLHIRRMKAAIKAGPRRSSDSLLIQVNPTPESNPLYHAYLIAYFVISNPNLSQSLGSAAPCHVTVAWERKNWRRNRKHDCLCMVFIQQCSTFNGPRWQSDKVAQIKENGGRGGGGCLHGQWTRH